MSGYLCTAYHFLYSAVGYYIECIVLKKLADMG